MLRTLAILGVLAAGLLSACGSEETQNSADARELLSRAFATPVESGRMSAVAEIDIDGVALLDNGLKLTMSGPFTREAADLDVSVGGFGPGLSGGLTFTEDNVWITVAGRAYELGEDAFSDLMGQTGAHRKDGDGALTLESLGIDLEEWLTGATVEGDDEVGGAAVTKITAEVDAARVLDDVGGLMEKHEAEKAPSADDVEKLSEFLEDANVEIYVGKADDVVRRAVIELEFEVPEDRRADLAGAEGGAISFDVTLSDVGEPQRIEPPADARPLDDLLGQFGFGPELLQQ